MDVTTPSRPENADNAENPPPAVSLEEPEVPEGIFHRVEAGQTLYRIAKAYGIGLETLARVNGISDPTRLDVGRELFVPGAKFPVEVAPYPAPLGTAAPPSLPVLAPSRATDFEWPVSGGRVLSYFGAPRRGHRHAGLDIQGARGQEILAARAGVVVYGGSTRTGYGRLVILDHGDGIESFYAHDDDVLVKIGDVVAMGQAIARVGSSGNATTPHCHFEIRRNRVAVDPLPYLTRIANARP